MDNIEYPFSLGPAKDAREILQRMETIVRNEQIAHGFYCRAPSEPDPHKLCLGHSFCAVGSLMFAGGAEITLSDLHEGAVIEEALTSEDQRIEAYQKHPHLAGAWRALTAVIRRRIESGEFSIDSVELSGNGLDAKVIDYDILEAFFEGVPEMTHDLILDVISEARIELAMQPA